MQLRDLAHCRRNGSCPHPRWAASPPCPPPRPEWWCKACPPQGRSSNSLFPRWDGRPRTEAPSTGQWGTFHPAMGQSSLWTCYRQWLQMQASSCQVGDVRDLIYSVLHRAGHAQWDDSLRGGEVGRWRKEQEKYMWERSVKMYSIVITVCSHDVAQMTKIICSYEMCMHI